MTINKVFITLLSVLFSAAFLSLNFMTVASVEVYEDIQLDAEPDQVVEMREEDRDYLKYAQIGPEVSYLGGFSAVDRPNLSKDDVSQSQESEVDQQENQESNFGFKKIRVVVQGDTIKFQTLNPQSAAEDLDATLMELYPSRGQDLSIRENRYLEDPDLYLAAQDLYEEPVENVKLSIPVIEIQYDRLGNYDSRKTWANVDPTDLLARAMLAEENEKLFDPERELDFIGAGWVMVNRTYKADDFFSYADENLFGALVPYFQFALGGVKDQTGRILPGNAAIVANPEAYSVWFGGDPKASYWKAYQIAISILNGTITDPTSGALYFADYYINEDGESVPFDDGRTRFWFRGYPSFSIPELQQRGSVPWASN